MGAQFWSDLHRMYLFVLFDCAGFDPVSAVRQRLASILSSTMGTNEKGLSTGSERGTEQAVQLRLNLVYVGRRPGVYGVDAVILFVFYPGWLCLRNRILLYKDMSWWEDAVLCCLRTMESHW